MRDPEKFDAFYKDARERLLAQTFALTGDLAASRRAVRDAFVVAWHRWRKLSTHEDPESVVRPHAWRLAQRHHTARVWHRDKDISPEVKATLDALGKLSAVQRRTLVLTQLAAVSMPKIAREVGVPLEAAERELQHAATQVALQLDVQAPAMRSLLDAVAASVSDTVTWPRATIVRRAGAARRRTHTGVGVLVAVTALIVSGSLVTDGTGVRPTLDRTVAAAPSTPTPDAPTTDAAAGVTDPLPPTLSEASLLGAAELGARYDRKWSVVTTNTNDEGTGLVLPCQTERYADPRGTAALMRTSSAKKTKRLPGIKAMQFTELSPSTKRARKAYRTTTSWFGDCRVEQTNLVSTAAPKGVGDESVQIVLRSRGTMKNTFVIGVARTGAYTTTTIVATGADDEPGLSGRRASARLLSGAVDKVCSLPDGGTCGASGVRLAPRLPLKAGDAPAMLSEIDIPPLADIKRPWVGTEPRSPITNDAASSCDSTTFRGQYDGKPFTNNATRTFVIPGAKLPAEFGLTQSLGSLPGDRAAALVQRVRGQLGSCDSLNTEVARITETDTKDTSLTAWRLEVEVTDSRTVTFFMAIMRNQTSVSQLGFLPNAADDVDPGAFTALARRALERLAELPPPRKT